MYQHINITDVEVFLLAAACQKIEKKRKKKENMDEQLICNKGTFHTLLQRLCTDSVKQRK
jgi:hypothetical protein